MANINENTVPSSNQLSKDKSVFGKEGTGKRILFLGNSITRHGVNESIGWYGDWGMAATSVDKDYVHRTMAKVWEIDPNASFLVAQVSLWEREFWNDQVIDDNYKDALAYNPDIIVMRAVENVRPEELQNHDFAAGYKNLLDRMNKSGKAKIIVTSAFWAAGERDKIILDLAEQNCWSFIYLADLGINDKYMAKERFENRAVGIHPGDVGMEEISDRIFHVLKESL